jgi:hypothetical protein
VDLQLKYSDHDQSTLSNRGDRKMRKFFAVAMGSLVALAGFAGTANASATIDLIWIDVTGTTSTGAILCYRTFARNCPQNGPITSSVVDSDSITLLVQITAGPGGILGAGVSVDYDGLTAAGGGPGVTVTGFQSMTTTIPGFYLPTDLGPTTNIPPFIDSINAVGAPFLTQGIGLPAGATAYLGTVTFHETNLVNGTFDVTVGTTGATDGVQRLSDNANIDDTTTFNSAAVVNVPEPGALSLLVMGLGGMLLAGRGRK